jgi:hypothetical protein
MDVLLADWWKKDPITEEETTVVGTNTNPLQVLAAAARDQT